jgi:predicted RNase H-like HicB family nuclease/DNA-binding XRE family transcriptional regulator
MVYHFKVHRESDGYWAECLELSGCVTEAASMDGLAENAREALNLYLEEPEGSTLSFPLPDSQRRGKNILAVPVEPGIALSVLLRKYRSERHYTQQDIASRLGMKNLYSYQRLERRSNPNLETLRKLKRVFPDLSVDYVLQG